MVSHTISGIGLRIVVKVATGGWGRGEVGRKAEKHERREKIKAGKMEAGKMEGSGILRCCGANERGARGPRTWWRE